MTLDARVHCRRYLEVVEVALAGIAGLTTEQLSLRGTRALGLLREAAQVFLHLGRATGAWLAGLGAWAAEQAFAVAIELA